MAGVSTVKHAAHSKTLFIDEAGAPRLFFMRPCSERQFLRPLIEHGGGKITSKCGAHCIKLAERGCTVSASDYISTKFIEDCVKNNKFLDTSSYSVPPGTVAREGSEKSFSSDDSMSPASTIIKTVSKSCKGRSKYTKEEDMAMIKFLVTERRYLEATGMRVWRDMQMLEVTSHTAESMNSRYRKVILPNIENYQHEVPPRWISLLTGTIQKEKEPEFSVDALFKPKPKLAKSPSPTKKSHTSDTINVADQQTTSQYFSKETPVSNSNQDTSHNHKIPFKKRPLMNQFQNSFTEETVNTGSVNKDKNVTEQNAEKESESIAKDNKESNDNPVPESTNEEMDTDEDLPLITMRRRLRKRHATDDQDNDTSNQGSPSKLITVELAHINNKQDDSKKAKNNKQLENKNSNSPKAVKSIAKASNGQYSNKTNENDKTPQKTRSTKKSPQKSSPKLPDQNSDSQSLLSCTKRLDLDINGPTSPKSTKFIQLDATETRSSRLRKRPDNTKESLESESKKSPVKEGSHIVHEKMKYESMGTRKVVMDQTTRLIKDKSDNAEVGEMCDANGTASKEIESDDDFDSFDKMLVGLAKQGHHKKVNVLADSDEEVSFNPEKLQDSLDVIDSPRKSSSSGTSPKKSPHKTTDKSDLTCTVVLHDVCKDIRGGENNGAGTPRKDQTKNGPADSTTNSVFSFEDDFEEDDDVIKCRKIFKFRIHFSSYHTIKCPLIEKGIAKKFSLPSEYVRQLLLRNSGNVDRTVSWIKFGVYSPWPPAWSEADNLALQDEEETDRLVVKYGEVDVRERMEFLGVH